MNPDDPVCLCFHVTRRKVINFIRVQKPHRPSQLSECFGAGTGCGWCRPYLERLLEQHRPGSAGSETPERSITTLDDLTMEQYQQAREAYRAQKREDSQ